MLINADLGEGESADRTAELMRAIDLANIACGGHAGTSETMECAVRLALENGVAIGAHPGLPGDFGRGVADIGGGDLSRMVIGQVAALATIVDHAGSELHHIKLHGALYHAVERSVVLARVYVETVKEISPWMTIVAFAGGAVLPVAREERVLVLAEVFAERGYRADGTLIPRGEPGDLIVDPAEVVARLPMLRGDTICVHSDSPNAVEIARAVRAVME